MKPIKPTVDQESAAALLSDELHIQFDTLTETGDGQIARTYALTMDGKPYILQFTAHNMSQGCLNERIFREKFRLMDIPIRRVLYEGDYAGYHYTIAERVQGIELHHLPMTDFMAILPSVMDLLLRIAQVDTSDKTGYGWFDKQGNGVFTSWREHLCFVKAEEPGQFYGNWHQLFDTTFLDRDVYEHYVAKMENLLECTPTRRELVHGGFGHGNVLVDEGQITAVLDWQDARYGDHVFDLAYMIHWFDLEMQQSCIDIYRAALEKLGRAESNLGARIRCYQYYTGIDGLRFAATTENEQFYQAALDKLASLDALA